MDIQNAGDRIMNTWLYPIEDGWVMFDTGYENSYPKVLKQLNKLLIKPEEVRYLFLTHAHDDHAGFLEEWVTKHPQTQVIAHEGAIEGLRRGQNSFDGGCSTLFAFLFCQLFLRQMYPLPGGLDSSANCYLIHHNPSFWNEFSFCS